MTLRPARPYRAALSTVLAVALGAVTLWPHEAAAETHLMGDDVEVIGVKAGDTLSGNLYAGSQKVTIAGRLDGDLVCGGTTVTIGPEAQVEGDVICGAQAIEIEGRVDGDVRGGAFVIRLGDGASVGGELLAGAFAVEIEEGATIGGDLMAGASQVRLSGTVEGDARLAAGGVEIGGEVGGDVRAEVGGAGAAPPPMLGFPQAVQMPAGVAPGLSILSGATIGGDLTYTSPEEADVPTGVVSGSTDHTPPRATPGQDRPSQPESPWYVGALTRALSLFVVGLLLLWLAPRLMAAGAGLLRGAPGPSLGWGCGTFFGALVAFIGVCIAGLLGLILLAGLGLDPLARVLVASSLLGVTLLTVGLYLLGWVGQAILALVVGRLVLRQGGADTESGLANRLPGALPALAVGALVICLVIGIPVPLLGGLLVLLTTAIGLGALLQALSARVRVTPMGGPEAGLPA